MEKVAAQLLAQGRGLRALAAELAHGAAREAFLARIDDELRVLATGGVRITLLPARGGSPRFASVAASLAADAIPTAALAILAPGGAASAAVGAVARGAIAPACAAAGIVEVRVVIDPHRVVSSPVLWGHVVNTTDVVVLAGTEQPDEAAALALAGLAPLARVLVCTDPVGEGQADPDLPMRDVRRCAPPEDARTWPAAIRGALGDAAGPPVHAEAALARLAQLADLLNRHLQAELVALKFRIAEIARLRKAEDGGDGSGDAREQAERLKAILEAWTRACQEDFARSAEHGLLPFDPRLLVNRLTIADLAYHEEKSAAVTKYPWLGARGLQAFLTHEYVVTPDAKAVDQVRHGLVTALATQVQKDVAGLNQRAQDLLARLRANATLYPQLAPALATLRVPALDAAALERPVTSIELEVDIEDKFAREGFFKRLMEGRMVASMAFSFLTMSAGVFVLFGEPNIKRGLMKFSGVIVIMMILYFVFSMLVKGEEEKHQLGDVLERLRARLNQEVMKPLAKAQALILKAYDAFVVEVAQDVHAVLEAVARARTSERAALVEQRKAEDELLKGFLARRQQAATTAAQKVPAFLVALEKTRVELQKPATLATSALRPASGAVGAISAVSATAAAAVAAGSGAAGAASSAAAQAASARVAAAPAVVPAAPVMSASERFALARAQAAERLASSPAARSSSASERIAAAKAALAVKAAAVPPTTAAPPAGTASPGGTPASAQTATAGGTPTADATAAPLQDTATAAATPEDRAPATVAPSPAPEPVPAKARAAD